MTWKGVNAMNLKEKWNDISYDLYLRFRPVRSFYYNFKYGLTNLIKYFKVIWNDRDWDESYLFILLHNKLSYMERLHREEGNSIHSLKYADEIKIARLLTERIVNRDYIKNALTPYHSKYGNENYEEWDDLEQYLSRTNRQNKDQIQMKKRAYKHSDNMEKQDIEYLFKFISKHIQNWWD